MESTIARPKEIAQEQKAPHALRTLRRETRQRLIETESNIREHPRQATLIAFGTGFLLSFLPLTAIVTAAIRVLLFLAKPALLILGAIKAVEEFKKSRPQSM